MTTLTQPDACRSCGRPLLWARHYLSNKPAPLDALPSATGTIELEPNGNYHIAPLAARAGRTDLYTNHFVTCPDRLGWKKP